MRIMLFIIIFAVPAVSLWLATVELSEFQVMFISILGTSGTLAGLLYAIAQIAQIRKESKIIADTASQTKAQVFLLMRVADWARGIKVAQEVQIHCRNGKREIAIPRIQELKEILQDIIHAADEKISSEHGNAALKQIVSLNLIINGFEKDNKSRISKDEVAKVNAILELTIDLLNKIQSITKNRG
jgi:hypothetical protein